MTNSVLPVRSTATPCGSSATGIAFWSLRVATSITATVSLRRAVTYAVRPSGLNATPVAWPPTVTSASLRRVAASTITTLPEAPRRPSRPRARRG